MHGCAAIIPLFALVACSVQAIGARQRDLAGLPHAVMICLDGFRHDYADRYHAVHLRKVGDDGASAALIPVYPSATYPSMYSLATGLRPANHGIVDAAFHDPLLSKAYDSRDASAVDPAWYGGTPLWKLAEQHGVRASVLTWVGYSRSGSAKHPDAETQLAEVMRLLGLPEPERPRLVMMYFADIDSAGHRYGPQSPEVGVAVRNLDEKIGRLRAWIQSLQFPVNLIIVSDHGMAELREVVFLEDLLDLRGVTVSGRGTQALLYFSNREAEGAAYRSLKRRAFGFAVYRRTETPARLRYRGNARIGNLVVMAKEGVVILRDRSSLAKTAAGSALDPVEAVRRIGYAGVHGYDGHRYASMRRVFYAAGPNIRSGRRVRSFESIHVYPLVARILNLRLPARLDANPSVLGGLFLAGR